MKAYNYIPKTANKVSNLSLYYDKFVYKEKIPMEKELDEVSKKLVEILGRRPTNRDIKNKCGEIKKIKTKWIKLECKTDNDTKIIKDIIEKPNEIVFTELKKYFKKRVFSRFDNINFSKEITSYNNIRNSMIKNLVWSNYKVFSAIFSLRTKFLIGSGIPSIDEVGFYWSRNYSIPIIPGSSVKGAFRNFIREEFDDMDSEVLFGSTDKASKLTFFDAIPTVKPTLKEIYQTPHFGEYYMNNESPNDVYNPVPISFIAVSSGEYRFDFVAKDVDDGTFKKLKDVFVQFLKFYGIGAKTSMGFGRFELIKR